MPDPLRTHGPRTATPQSEQADPRQVKNAAGGYTFKVSDMTKIRRFLTLGTDGGTYYTSERDLTKNNAAFIIKMAQGKSAKVLVNEAVRISQEGRAPRNNPAIFALAAVAGLGDVDDRRLAMDVMPQVVRTGTHLFQFVGYLEQFRGWGRVSRRGVSSWYSSRDADRLAYQLVKYRQREGWTHRDVIRKAHPVHQPLFEWVTSTYRKCSDDGCTNTAIVQDTSVRYVFWCPEHIPHPDSLKGGSIAPLVQDLAELPELIEDFQDAQVATRPGQWVQIIHRQHGISHEMLPDEARKHPEVWRALLEAGMPQTALIRQLPTMTRLGVLQPMSSTLSLVAAQIANPDILAKARVHPVNILVALRTYASGHSVKGDATWEPLSAVVDALDSAFYRAFKTIEPAGKRTMLALDVSGSMVGPVSGLPISCREATAALALVTAATEPSTMTVGFTSASGLGWRASPELSPLDISPRQRIDDAIRKVSNLPFGGTDCALPMQIAMQEKWEIDTFHIYTDNETWAGSMHPHQALRKYRDKMGINARMVVVGMTATDVSIADPDDPGQMDVAGFDSAVPKMIADFSRGDI